nr:MAG TPA: hypothetical protein [Caudoviricetes sp.]
MFIKIAGKCDIAFRASNPNALSIRFSDGRMLLPAERARLQRFLFHRSRLLHFHALNAVLNVTAATEVLAAPAKANSALSQKIPCLGVVLSTKGRLKCPGLGVLHQDHCTGLAALAVLDGVVGKNNVLHGLVLLVFFLLLDFKQFTANSLGFLACHVELFNQIRKGVCSPASRIKGSCGVLIVVLLLASAAQIVAPVLVIGLCHIQHHGCVLPALVHLNQRPTVQNIPFFTVLHGRLAALCFKQHPHFCQLLFGALHPEEPGVIEPFVALDVHRAGVLENTVEGAGFHGLFLSSHAWNTGHTAPRKRVSRIAWFSSFSLMQAAGILLTKPIAHQRPCTVWRSRTARRSASVLAALYRFKVLSQLAMKLAGMLMESAFMVLPSCCCVLLFSTPLL